MKKKGIASIGIDRFPSRIKKIWKQANAGLLTHAAAVDKRLICTAEKLAATGIRLNALYGPEHGVHGDFQAGEPVPFRLDPLLGIPVYSLYEHDIPPERETGSNMDARMRDFDSRPDGWRVKPEILGDIDLMICDLQDVGTRIYTYTATLISMMEACVQANIPLLVLDRPNPITGIVLEGPMLDYPRLSSPIGALPVPLRHGMTLGEMALLANDILFKRKADLHVVPLRGWTRSDWFDETGLPWIPPSPNMPTLDTAAVYPGQVLFEGTNLSEGRGTTRPFETFGAPWLDGLKLAERLNGLQIPGVHFRPHWFSPWFSKYAGEICCGLQIHITDRRRFRPVTVSLHILSAILALHPDRLKFHQDYFDRAAGTEKVRRQLEEGWDAARILDQLKPDISRFQKIRRPYLLY